MKKKVSDDKAATSFIELLQIALGNRTILSSPCSDRQWEEIYHMARKQAMTGIIFYAATQLPADMAPPTRLKSMWTLNALQIEDTNKKQCKECKTATEFFANNGLFSCILKGQSNLFFYPPYLRMLRMPGDIDIWTFKKEDTSKRIFPKKDIILLVWDKTGEKSEVNLHHIDCRLFPKTPVEVHFVPSFAVNPFTDRKYIRWFHNHKSDIISTKAGYNILDINFNIIFQMMHIYRHLLLEGIGFRQLIDLYFTLVSREKRLEATQDQKYDKSIIFQELCNLGMKRITEAVMWILHSILAMDEKHLICKPSEKYGREMLDEIMRGGNFGQHYKSPNTAETAAEPYISPDDMTREGRSMIRDKMKRFHEFYDACRHGFRLIASYPEEVLWIPYLYIKAFFVRNYWRKQ